MNQAARGGGAGGVHPPFIVVSSGRRILTAIDDEHSEDDPHPDGIRVDGSRPEEEAVSSMTRSIGWRAVLALGLVCALIGVGSSAVVQTQAGALVTGPIKSGAGPGWPATLSPNDFVARVDNPWFPLRPGSEYRYTGLKDRTKMVDVVRVTTKTKRVLGVETTVVHDVVKVDGRPEEETDDYYAQDRHGNVWYFGESTKTFDSHGKVVSTEGSFEAGVDGERAGVLIPGHPRVGQVGRQEFSPGEAEDHFRVLDLSAGVSVPFVSSQQALRTREWTPLEPAVVDNKYYVRGIGTVSEVAFKGPVEQLRLVSYRKGKGA